MCSFLIFHNTDVGRSDSDDDVVVDGEDIDDVGDGDGDGDDVVVDVGDDVGDDDDDDTSPVSSLRTDPDSSLDSLSPIL